MQKILNEFVECDDNKLFEILNRKLENLRIQY